MSRRPAVAAESFLLFSFNSRFVHCCFIIEKLRDVDMTKNVQCTNKFELVSFSNLRTKNLSFVVIADVNKFKG